METQCVYSQMLFRLTSCIDGGRAMAEASCIDGGRAMVEAFSHRFFTTEAWV